LKLTRRSLSFLLAGLTAAPAWAQAPVIQISGANFRPLPLALAQPLTSDPAARSSAAEFDDALSFDLTASGIFQMLDRKSFIADPKEGLATGSINFGRWSNVGAEALVKTQLTVDGGNLKGELRLFGVPSAREEFKLSQSVPMKDARRLAHIFADGLYQYYTRETGPFQSRVTFVRKSGTSKDVWLSDWDGKNARPVTNGGINVLPGLVPDGASVAFTSYLRGHPEIFVQRPGGQPTPVVSGVMATGIAYSPDGRRIAYSMAQGEAAQIFVANTDGSGARAVTNTPFIINSSPTWSPDGKRLAFVSNRGGSPQIYVMSAEGGEAKRLTFQGNYNQTPDWSPRGDLIAFTARDERNAFDLFTVNVDNGKITRLTQDQGNNEEPVFSPNGRLILFSSNRKGGSGLYVMTFEGNNQVQLPADRSQATTPDWGR